jgi:hypothetical protein
MPFIFEFLNKILLWAYTKDKPHNKHQIQPLK